MNNSIFSKDGDILTVHSKYIRISRILAFEAKYKIYIIIYLDKNFELTIECKNEVERNREIKNLIILLK